MEANNPCNERNKKEFDKLSQEEGKDGSCRSCWRRTKPNALLALKILFLILFIVMLIVQINSCIRLTNIENQTKIIWEGNQEIISQVSVVADMIGIGVAAFGILGVIFTISLAWESKSQRDRIDKLEKQERRMRNQEQSLSAHAESLKKQEGDIASLEETQALMWSLSYRNNRKYQYAKEELSKALEKYRNSPKLNFEMGQIYLELIGQPDLCDKKEEYKRNAEVYLKRALKYYEEKRDCEHQAECRIAISSLSGLMGQRPQEEDLTELEKAIELDLNSKQIRINAAIIYLECGNQERAFENFRKAVKLDLKQEIPQYYYMKTSKPAERDEISTQKENAQKRGVWDLVGKEIYNNHKETLDNWITIIQEEVRGV